MESPIGLQRAKRIPVADPKGVRGLLDSPLPLPLLNIYKNEMIWSQ